MNENRQFGRTFFDYISEYPRTSFSIFLIFLAIILYLKIPIEYDNFKVNQNKSTCDTITIVKHDTIYVTKLKYVSQKNSDDEKIMPTKEINITSNNQQGGQTGNEINNNY